jgi:hypothetical protein
MTQFYTETVLVRLLNRRNRDFSRTNRDIFPDDEKQASYRGFEPLRSQQSWDLNQNCAPLMRYGHTGHTCFGYA